MPVALSTPKAPSLWLPDPPPPQKGTRAGVGAAQGTLGLVCAREEEATQGHEAHLVRAEAATAMRKGVCEPTGSERALKCEYGRGWREGSSPESQPVQAGDGVRCNVECDPRILPEPQGNGQAGSPCWTLAGQSRQSGSGSKHVIQISSLGNRGWNTLLN